MKRKFAGFIFALLFVFSSALAAYRQCVQAGDHFDSGTAHEAPLIHCPEVASSSSAQISYPRQGYNGDPVTPLVSFAASLKTIPGIPHVRERALIKTFSQQDLYRLEEVFRL